MCLQVALEAARIAPNQIAQVAQAKSLLPEDATFQPEKVTSMGSACGEIHCHTHQRIAQLLNAWEDWMVPFLTLLLYEGT